MNKETVLELSKNYLLKISDYYGFSKFQETTPYISLEDSLYSDSENEDIVADYCFMHNEIQVYWKNIRSIEHLIRTLVHEYQHYLQSPSWMTRYYNQGYSYDNHPYEIKAYKEEESWNKFI